MKLTVDQRYNHIAIEWKNWDELFEIKDWCDDNGQYEIYVTGIVYKTEQDLTAFMLRFV